MGYRSDVAVSMFRKDFDRLIEFSKEEKVLKDLIKYADSIKETTDNIVVIKWDSIKWYEEFPEIQALNEFLCEVPYCFTRTGEEYGDVEHEDCCGDHYELDCIYPVTYIESPDGKDVELNLD